MAAILPGNYDESQQIGMIRKLQSLKQGAAESIADIADQLASVSLSKVKRVELQSKQAGLTSPKPSREALAKLDSIGLQARPLRTRKQ